MTDHNYMIIHRDAVGNTPRTLFPEDTPCGGVVACVRSIISGIQYTVPTEQKLLDKYRLSGINYISQDIKTIGVLNQYSVLYGCDKQETYSFDTVLELLQTDHYIMMKTHYQSGHWVLLLGYYPYANANSLLSKCLIYDPSIDEVVLTNTNSLIDSWLYRDGDKVMCGDFIAVHKDKRRPDLKGASI